MPRPIAIPLCVYGFWLSAQKPKIPLPSLLRLFSRGNARLVYYLVGRSWRPCDVPSQYRFPLPIFFSYRFLYFGDWRSSPPFRLRTRWVSMFAKYWLIFTNFYRQNLSKICYSVACTPDLLCRYTTLMTGERRFAVAVSPSQDPVEWVKWALISRKN